MGHRKGFIKFKYMQILFKALMLHFPVWRVAVYTIHTSLLPAKREEEEEEVFQFPVGNSMNRGRLPL